MPRLKKIIEYLTCLFIFLLPWQTVYLLQERFLNGFKWEYGSFGSYLTESLLWLIILLQSIVWVKEKKNIFKKKYVWFFLIWGALSIFWAKDKVMAGYYFLHLLEAVLFFFVVLTAQLEKKKIFWMLVLAGSVQSLLGICQFLNQEIVASKWLGIAGRLSKDLGVSVVQYGDYRWLRAYGSFTHPNVLGGFLAVCLLAGVYLYSILEKSWKKVFLSTCLLILTAGLFFSFSRSAWLGLVLGILILFFQKKTSKKILIYIFSFFIILSIIYYPLVSTRIVSNERLEVKSSQERTDLISQAKGVIKENIFLGAGLGNYTAVISEKNPTLPGWDLQPVHSLYFLIWAELGMIGFILFLFLILKSNNLLILPFLFIGFFDHYFFTQYFGLILFFFTLAFFSKSVMMKKNLETG